MAKEDTRRILSATTNASTDEFEKALKVFSDHARLASQSMHKAEAAIHTGYVAATNFLAAYNEARKQGESRGGVREVK